MLIYSIKIFLKVQKDKYQRLMMFLKKISSSSLPVTCSEPDFARSFKILDCDYPIWDHGINKEEGESNDKPGDLIRKLAL